MSVEKSKEYLIFQLLDEKFAVLSEKALEIVQTTRITKLPKMPSFFLGVMNLRGNLYPAVDLRLILKIPYLETTKDTVFIIVSVNDKDFEYNTALRADRVCDVETVKDLDLMPHPQSGSLVPEKFLSGSFLYNDEVVLILSTDVLCSRKELNLIESE
jgi:purine-binding chemotaxis protein CheW